MRRRHKTNWERVIAAIESITGNCEAVEILRRELMPKYKAIVAKRERARAAANAYRSSEKGRARHMKYNREYSRVCRAENRELYNAASRDCHRRKRAEMKKRREG